jgi:hypothetical protein
MARASFGFRHAALDADGAGRGRVRYVLIQAAARRRLKERANDESVQPTETI